MPNIGRSRDPNPSSTTGAPSDIPVERPAALARLEALLGEWDMEAEFGAGYFGPDSPSLAARGSRTTVEWLKGEFFLVQRFSADNPTGPSGIAIIGTEEESDRFSQHYYDSRGVARVYQMSLKDGVWKLWREAPGFWQHYTGVFSGDGETVKGAWEASPDGSKWKRDFGLTYHKSA